MQTQRQLEDAAQLRLSVLMNIKLKEREYSRVTLNLHSLIPLCSMGRRVWVVVQSWETHHHLKNLHVSSQTSPVHGVSSAHPPVVRPEVVC